MSEGLALHEQMRAQSLANHTERQRTAPRHVDNSRMQAGKPMLFYCQSCGWISDIKPENYFLSTGRALCGECYAMKLRGWLPDSTSDVPTR